MEAVSELQQLYEKALDITVQAGKNSLWEASEYVFDEDPPCIKALVEHGVFELGSINAAQFRLAAYLKVGQQTAPDVIRFLDSWLRTIPAKYIYEHNFDGTVNYKPLEAQNRYVARTVFASSQYGFSCAGIKQLVGVSEFCTNKCEDEIQKELTVSLFDALKAEYRHKRLSVYAECIGRRDAVFVIPKVITAYCTGSATIGTTKCVGCSLYGSNDSPVDFEVNAASRHILTFLEPSRVNLSGKIATVIGIQRRECSTWKWSLTEQNVETIYIVPPITNEFADEDRHTRQEAFFIGYGTQTNQPYKFTGYAHVNDNNNLSKLVLDTRSETADSLNEFEQTPEMKEASKIFQPKEESVIQKYEDIIQSLVYNHIKIWGRDAMVMAMDLAYHSVRRIVFQRNLIRGWIDLLVIGDSGQGKTKAAIGLMDHYGLGYKASAEAATRAGLMYGVEVKKNSPSCLIWGALPRHTGRLVIIDELKGLIEKGHFAELTDARSSGIVKVDTIVSGKATSETRLIMMTNPPPRMFMGSYMYGVEAIPDLIPDFEDTRRCDMVVGVASQEIADEVIHQDIEKMVVVDDVYGPDVCKNHLLWVWNLRPDDISIPRNVEETTLALSLKMCKLYSSMIPIVEPADQREKLIRVATAFAARLNSVTSKGVLVVQEDHIRAAYAFMNSLYRASGLKYDVYSKINARINLSGDLATKLKVELRNGDWVTHWKRLVWYVAEEHYIQPKILAVVAQCSLKIAGDFVNWCVAYKLCKMLPKGSFVKTPNGVTFFKNMIEEELGKKSQKVVKERKVEGGEEF